MDALCPRDSRRDTGEVRVNSGTPKGHAGSKEEAKRRDKSELDALQEGRTNSRSGGQEASKAEWLVEV